MIDLEGPRGPGKVIAVSGGEIKIEYFASITRRKRVTSPLDPDRLQLYQPSPQERCYIGTPSGWLMGRIRGLPDPISGVKTYWVQFPNQDYEDVSPDNLFVRWWEPSDEPFDTLAALGHETPFFHLRRRSFLQSLVHQRSASRGLTSILSSSVELHPHQLDVVRRVMEDSVQRYLLADEVGLGKTIEAGLILRQVLLEMPDADVVVVVPQVLAPQWRSELDSKFGLADFPGEAVTIVPHGEVREIDPGRRCELLIIDEAHNIAGGHGGPDDETDKAYAHIARLAHSARRLLLLSATPVRQNELAYLKMLHLLEPEIYRLDDVAGFERRVTNRVRIATTLAALTEEAVEYPFIIENAIAHFEAMLEDDSRLGELASLAREAFRDRATSRDTLKKHVRDIRLHVSDTYRLHRRMIRYRRDGIAGNLVRGRSFAGTILFRDDRRDLVENHLNTWREAVASHLRDHPAQRDHFMRIARKLYAAAGSDLSILTAVVRDRLDGNGVRVGEAARPIHRVITEELQPLKDLRDVLENPTRSDRTTAFISWLRHNYPLSVLSPPAKVIAFTAFTEVAQKILGAIGASSPGKTYAGHHGAMTDSERLDALKRFEGDAACSLLVCDANAEEGLNLQHAAVIVHIDLPWDANRVEQRIGRVDRFGRGDAAKSFSMSEFRPGSGYSPTIEGAHATFLSEGLSVFDRSIAALQHFVEDEEHRFLEAALTGGSRDATSQVGQVRERISEAFREVDLQDQIDAIEVQSEGDLEAFVEQLMDCEASGLASRQDAWMTALGFRSHKRRGHNGRDRLIRYSADPRTALIPWNRLQSGFASVVGEDSSRWSTYSRMAAVRNPEARLLRLGDPVVDALHAYLQIDDRGQAFAFWRHDPSLPNEDPLVVFRLDFLVEADLGLALEHLGRAGHSGPTLSSTVNRRLDSALHPRIQTQWKHEDGTTIEDLSLLKILGAPYNECDAYSDINLRADRLWALWDIIPSARWAATCAHVQDRARESFTATKELTESVADALARVQSNQSRRTSALRARLHARSGDREALQDEIMLEELIGVALHRAITDPRLRLDAMGAVVLSPANPFARVDAE